MLKMRVTVRPVERTLRFIGEPYVGMILKRFENFTIGCSSPTAFNMVVAA